MESQISLESGNLVLIRNNSKHLCASEEKIALDISVENSKK